MGKITFAPKEKELLAGITFEVIKFKLNLSKVKSIIDRAKLGYLVRLTHRNKYRQLEK